MSVCGYVHVSIHAHGYQKCQEAGAGVTGDYELPDTGAGTEQGP